MGGIRKNPWTDQLDFTADQYFQGNLFGPPSNPQVGWIYINSTDNTMYVYYGGQWQAIVSLTQVSVATANPVGLLLSLTYA